MKFLLDTMVVSEPARPQPNASVLAWLESQVSSEIAISVLTLGEIARGVARLGDGKRKARLEKWLATELPSHFDKRVLNIDAQVARAWGELMAHADKIGRHLPVIDGLLLSTAVVHGLTIVTRNENDFRERGVALINPYH